MAAAFWRKGELPHLSLLHLKFSQIRLFAAFLKTAMDTCGLVPTKGLMRYDGTYLVR